jgi:hypothetical protein
LARVDQATLDLLNERIEVDARTPRRDGSISSRPIWVVVVDGAPYVRSYHGESAAWYRRALADGRLVLAADGDELTFGVEPIEDKELDRRVSAAFRTKYGRRSPKSTDAMVLLPEVVATTLRLTQS